MTTPKPTRPRYELVLEAAPGADVTLRLRCALKALSRRFGLRCVSVREVGAETKIDTTKNPVGPSPTQHMEH